MTHSTDPAKIARELTKTMRRYLLAHCAIFCISTFNALERRGLFECVFYSDGRFAGFHITALGRRVARELEGLGR